MKNSISINTRLTERSLYKWLFFCLLFFLALIISGGNTYNPDYAEYERRYINLIQSSHTGLFLFVFEFVFNKLGCSYQFFRFIECFLSLLLLSKTVTRYSTNPIFVFSLYLIYPFLLDSVQLGNFISYSIVLYSLKYLEEPFTKGGIKYIFGVLIASQFHILSIVYIIFLLVYVKSIRKIYIFSFFTNILLTISINFLPRLVSYIPLLRSRSDQIKYYLSFDQSYKNGAIAYSFLLFVCLLVLLTKVYIIKCNISFSQDNTFNKALKIAGLTFCFIPFILINSEFVRLIRNTWVIYYLALSCDMRDYSDNLYKLDKLYKAFSIFLAVFLFYKELSPYAYYFDTVTKPVLLNNILW